MGGETIPGSGLSLECSRTPRERLVWRPEPTISPGGALSPWVVGVETFLATCAAMREVGGDLMRR